MAPGWELRAAAVGGFGAPRNRGQELIWEKNTRFKAVRRVLAPGGDFGAGNGAFCTTEEGNCLFLLTRFPPQIRAGHQHKITPGETRSRQGAEIQALRYPGAIRDLAPQRRRRRL
ncbi:hypothetical protein AV530_011438 [Patagioenas fasciata monilis]|uniref:Uncharacterized protein n=1 Tax=Patagioenas fasciata monilis TaxID=372326 RepID=A0A1V4KPE8_PATFA|nr:hypothetical protein AV530_011438 [Patagioenas fasciata monilis]